MDNASRESRPSGMTTNPRISVCIAAFQGEKYIAAQLRSILAQLSDNDEVVVVDDHSSDGTCSIVRSVADSRVRLIERTTNQGPAKTFQEALLQASGNIIFLSDQDDIWLPEKVTAVLKAFEENPKVTMVVTDAALIDEGENRVGQSYYRTRGKFRVGVFSNVIRCKFLGCTMAFRSELISKALPIPDGVGMLHDFWLGAVNSMTDGGTVYLDIPLVLYRKHSGAVTAGELGLKTQLHIRANLVKTSLKFWMRRRFWRRQD
jgi:glycosyltransferase involved in cell wall biosynthesis